LSVWTPNNNDTVITGAEEDSVQVYHINISGTTGTWSYHVSFANHAGEAFTDYYVQAVSVDAFENRSNATEKVKYYAEPKLSIMKLPAGLTRVEVQAFYNTGAEAVLLPEGCKVIASGAFANLANLRYIYIPASVSSIGTDAFLNDSNLIILAPYNSKGYEYAISNGITWAQKEE